MGPHAYILAQIASEYWLLVFSLFVSLSEIKDINSCLSLRIFLKCDKYIFSGPAFPEIWHAEERFGTPHHGKPSGTAWQNSFLYFDRIFAFRVYLASKSMIRIPCLSVCRYWRDFVVIAAFSVFAAIGSYQGAKQVSLALFDTSMESVWFQSDIPGIYENMTNRGSDHYCTYAHPLFSMVALPPTEMLWRVFGINSLVSVRIVMAFIASLWAAAFFILFRLVSFHRLEAILFSALGMVSAAATFWFTVPGTYPFGSLSILLALVIAALSHHQTRGRPWHVIANMATLSFATTNWMIGIFTSFINLPWRRAAQVVVNAFFIITVLWAIQKFFIPSAGFFLAVREETKYFFTADSGGILRILTSFFLHSMVMPSINSISNPEHPHTPIMTIQHSLPGSGGPCGVVATVLWAVLLCLGVWGIIISHKHNKFRLVLGVSLLGQIILHASYGKETFLYSLHFGPLLVLLAAFGTRTRLRRLVIAYVSILVVCTVINNWQQFGRATALIQDNHTPRSEVKSQMLIRPADPWPRGKGHIVLALPGSSEADKSYHEPGGSFSPTAGSFGVSLWVTDGDGNKETTSDDIPFDMIRQLFYSNGNWKVPKVLTETPYYRASWSIKDPSSQHLYLEREEDTAGLTIAIRSVGPAGGPVESLEWNGKRLVVNNRWHITISPTPAAVYLGEEGQNGWIHNRPAGAHWQSRYGWGYARIVLGNDFNWNMSIRDVGCTTTVPGISAVPQSPLEISVPERRFKDCLEAQVHHLLMSLVGTETRNADPVDTEIPGQRTGAYIIAALARAGYFGTAKELSYYLATHDFSGGFESETDAPGLAIWALKEVALRLNNPEFNQWLWPHITRKAELIQEMILTGHPAHRTSIAPIVPGLRSRTDNTLIAEPGRNGLIVGRMDYHLPFLYRNAISYRGLIDAASLADHLHHPIEAARWRAYALILQQAWGKAFSFPETINDRTYICALWPTWVATSQTNTLIQNLIVRWIKQRDNQGDFCNTPIPTYFRIAEAHQWLYLGFQQHVWMTLNWFWDHQASPGLYTWWENNRKGNVYNGWHQIRGWVNPPHVTPHYWTAAEMLLLQLDMLAYVDGSADEPTLVIGAGIPEEWLSQTMHVQGLSTVIGYTDWVWKNQKMHVIIKNCRSAVKVRLGAAFPSKTPLHVEYRTYL